MNLDRFIRPSLPSGRTLRIPGGVSGGQVKDLYGRVGIGELAAFVWMPLALALCDRAQLKRFGVISAIGIVFALLLLSHFLSAVVFTPVIFLYAMVSGKGAFVGRIGPALIGVALGTGLAAIYLFPLVAYNRLFDLNLLPIFFHDAEFGRYFLMASANDISQHRFFIPGMIGLTFLTLVVARYVWRAEVDFVTRLVMLLTLGLGILMVIPNFGPRLVEVSGIKTSGFASTTEYSLKMLFTSLLTMMLGILAYCRVANAGIDGRERLLLLVSCGAFILMLPWSAPIWKAIPQLQAFQFPWRLCGILTVAVAGLLAGAIDDGLRRRAGGTPSAIVMSAVVFGVIGGGIVTWGAETGFFTREPHRVDVRDVDYMHITYVPEPYLSGFARIIALSGDNIAGPSTPVGDGAGAEVTRGRCAASVVRVTPRKLHVSARCEGDARLRVDQLYFPLWRIAPVTQNPLGESLGSSAEGLVEVSLTSGRHDFELVFDGGAPERYGAILSLVSALAIAGGFVLAGDSAWKRLRRILSASSAI